MNLDQRMRHFPQFGSLRAALRPRNGAPAGAQARRGVSRAGLTLVEIVMALSIVALLMSFMVVIVIQIVATQSVVEANRRGNTVGPAVLRLMQRDLEGVMIYLLNTGRDQEDAEDERRDYFIGEDAGSFDGGLYDELPDVEDSLHFVTTVDSTLRIGGKQSDIAEVGYFLRERVAVDDEENVPEGLFVLYRREDYHLDKRPTRGGKMIPLSDSVLALSFRYYRWPESAFDRVDFYEGQDDPEEEWDNTVEEALPMAVEVVVWVDVSTAAESRKPREERPFQMYRQLIMLPRFPSLEELTDEETGPGPQGALPTQRPAFAGALPAPSPRRAPPAQAAQAACAPAALASLRPRSLITGEARPRNHARRAWRARMPDERTA